MGETAWLYTPLPFVGISVAQIIWALIVIVAGLVIVKVFESVLKKSFSRLGLPALVSGLIVRLITAVMYVAVLLSALSALGISTDSVVLGLSAVIGLILGFGMQDTMTNLAAGIWLAVIRPFDKGHVVTINGMTGKVNSIGILATELLTPDNTVIMIPNKVVWGSPIINSSKMPVRRVEVNVGVAYGTDLKKAFEIAQKLMRDHELVLKDPEPTVALTELGDSALNLSLRAWTNTENYWKVKADLTIGIYEAFSKAGIEIPYPQLDVHIRKE